MCVSKQVLRCFIYHQQQVLVTSFGCCSEISVSPPSTTSDSSSNLAGSMAMRWLSDHFLRLHPYDNTSSRVSLHVPGQWNLSRSSDNIRATPGWPCWQCTKASRSGTRQFGIASTDVFRVNTPTRSHTSHSKLCGYLPSIYSVPNLSTHLALHVPPTSQHSPDLAQYRVFFSDSRPSEEHPVTTAWHVRSLTILTVVRDVPTLPRRSKIVPCLVMRSHCLGRLTYRMSGIR